ncbi:MAG: response regulator [Myxococcaceae bacterium]
MKRILVVDDDRNAMNGLSALLEMDGYEVLGFTSSEDALQRLQSEEHFDAVITDLEMPKVHGLEMVRAARTGARELPVIVVTAYVNSPASKSAFALGAKAVLNKPLKYDTLLEALPPP